MSSILDNYFKIDGTTNSLICNQSLLNKNCSYYINCNYANKLYSYLKAIIELDKDKQNQEYNRIFKNKQNQEYNRIFKKTIIACNNLINKRLELSSIDTLLNHTTQIDIDKNIIYKVILLIDNIDVSNTTNEEYKKLLEDYTKKYGNLLLNNYDNAILEDLKLKISKLVESIPENISFINPIFDINDIIIEVISNDKKINNKGSIIQINYKTKTFNIEYNNSIIIPNIPFDNLCIENIEIAPYTGYPAKNIRLITGSTKTKSITPLCKIIINCTNVKKLKEKLEYHLSYNDANKQSNLYIGTFLKILETSTSMLSSYTARKVFHLLSNITTDNNAILSLMTNYNNIYNSKIINLEKLEKLEKLIEFIDIQSKENISQITINNPIFNDKEIQIIYKNNNKSYNGYITQINLYTIPPTFIFEYEINSKNKSVIENPPNFSSLCIKSDRIYERYNKCITELANNPVSILLYNNNGVNKEVNHVINTGSYYNEDTFRPSCRYFINCRDALILKKKLIEFKDYELNNNDKSNDNQKFKIIHHYFIQNIKYIQKMLSVSHDEYSKSPKYEAYINKYTNELNYCKNILLLLFNNISIDISLLNALINTINFYVSPFIRKSVDYKNIINLDVIIQFIKNNNFDEIKQFIKNDNFDEIKQFINPDDLSNINQFIKNDNFDENKQFIKNYNFDEIKQFIKKYHLDEIKKFIQNYNYEEYLPGVFVLNTIIEKFIILFNLIYETLELSMNPPITFINPVILHTSTYKLSIKIKSKIPRYQHEGEMITINLQNNTFNAWNSTTKQIIRDIPFTQLCIKSNDDKSGTMCYDSLRDNVRIVKSMY